MDKQMSRKIAALVCALLMLFALAGCGAQQTEQPRETPGPAPVEETEEIRVVTPAPEPTLEPTPEPTPEPPMEPIDVGELPESLDAFLTTFAGAYADREGGREFDSRNCVDVRANIVSQIVNTVSCVDFSLYPGAAPVYHRGDNSPDREGWKGSGDDFALFDPEQIEWIAEEIFRLSPSDYRAVLARSVNSGAFYPGKNAAGEERYFLALGSGRRPETFVRYLSAVSNGQDYEIVYDLLQRSDLWLGTYAATLSLREIDGKSYWTLLRHTQQNAAYEETQAPGLFAAMAGVYTLSDSESTWLTELNIAADGSFFGSYTENSFIDAGEDCDQIVYYAEFEGRFADPLRIGPSSYSIELESLSYLDTMPDFIVEEDGGWRILYRYAEAVGLEGCRLFYVYAPGAPLYQLPESFVAWYGSRAALGADSMELPGWGLMNSVNGYGFASD